MVKKIRIVLAQLNLTVGDIAGNLEKHIQAAISARDDLSADIIVFPELGLTGYPAEDLLFQNDFLNAAQKALEHFIATVKDIYCIVSHPHMTSQGLYNSCSLTYNGAILGRYAKQYLPNYGVFDEDRYFIAGNSPCVISVHGILIGLVICEDLWFPGPAQQAASLGARLILSPNASPFEVDKHERRVDILTKRAKQNQVAILYVNNVGGQDGLIFDGGSMVIDDKGQLCQFAGFFNETLLPIDVDLTSTQTNIENIPALLPSDNEKIYQALVLSVRDYVNKNHFPGVYIGVSGGIDSALTLAIAVDALGKDRVQAIIMPSRYTADISIEDAKGVADLLKVKSHIISIEPTYKAFLESLAPSFKDMKPDFTEENIQARCRAIILMGLSNKFGSLVLTTGNRSELAVGYCTLYGDMAGGFCVLKDVPKTLVYSLAAYRNNVHYVIPKRIIERAPTAELAPNQKDEDSLPPYAILDQILYAYLNENKRREEIISQGFDPDLVNKVIILVKKSEYKRQQSAIGTRINNKSFGKDRRYPITNGFKG